MCCMSTNATAVAAEWYLVANRNPRFLPREEIGDQIRAGGETCSSKYDTVSYFNNLTKLKAQMGQDDRESRVKRDKDIPG